MNNELYFKDCFTEIEEGKINAEFNKIAVKCLESIDNKFSMDCEGNLVVNSLITREKLSNESVTIDDIYPVGSIYMSAADTDPSTLFGGVWERIAGRFLLGAGENEDNTRNDWGTYPSRICNFINGDSGGEVGHKLNINELPKHNHNISKRTAPQVDFSLGLDAMHFSGDMYAENYRITMETSDAGADAPHNNMPPFLVVNIWKRVA